jgi:hypothetical protein
MVRVGRAFPESSCCPRCGPDGLPGRHDYPEAPRPGGPGDRPIEHETPEAPTPGVPGDRSTQPETPWPEPDRHAGGPKAPSPARKRFRLALEILGVVFIGLFVVALISNATHSGSSHSSSNAAAGGGSGGGGHSTATRPTPPVLDYHAHVVNTSSALVNLTNPTVGLPDQTFLFTQAIEITNRNPSYVPPLLRVQVIRDGQPVPIRSPILNGQPIHGGTSLLIPGAQQISLTISYLRGSDIGDHATLEISSNDGTPDKESPAVWFDEQEGTAYDYGQPHP